MQNNLTLIDKLNHIKNLFILGKSDGNLNEKEIQIISEIAKHHQLSINEINYILSDKTQLPFSLPKTFTDRLALLYDLVLLMVSDLYIHENERELCIDLAKKFEFNPQIIDELTEDILSFVIEGKECDEAMNYLIKYAHPKQNLN
ncbi:hypothetical protein SAMN05421738_101131 [Algoriella xinjiangensis]|uniref:Tellurite resistance protein TerB n=1 Tax=Algoriella xinjiangensis TaxID=684065 RepID=A0A1I4SAW3_9FLAO|nr:hypothetical protein [Algoriella xinjiangensis]SFM61627.1 hypothetical protein SAMN05421738_101131 [Algoriella xinjiangensis]